MGLYWLIVNNIVACYRAQMFSVNQISDEIIPGTNSRAKNHENIVADHFKRTLTKISWNIFLSPANRNLVRVSLVPPLSSVLRLDKLEYNDPMQSSTSHDDVIKWKHFPRYWPFVQGIHRSTVNSPHKGQWRGALVFSLISAWINGWLSNRDSRRHRAHHDVTVMWRSWRTSNVIKLPSPGDQLYAAHSFRKPEQIQILYISMINVSCMHHQRP